MRDNLLPDKLSDLIDVAISDMEKCLALPNIFVVDMENWCYPHLGGARRCSVCLAGAVIAQTLCGGIPPEVSLLPSNFPRPLESKLRALDYSRNFLFGVASEVLNPDNPGVIAKCAEIQREFRDCAQFDRAHPEMFCADMRRAAEMLREVGL